jgi:16S rRNA (guanine966-N2)-methyltransferase
MRITAGILGGRTFEVPKNEVRPTQDKVRQALFSALGNYVIGARVLELFAGSGSLGLEAWSRGAQSVCWVELDGKAYTTLKKNVERLCTEPDRVTQCVRSDVFRFLEGTGARDGLYDLVLADPPYDRDASKAWLEKTLHGLAARPILKSGGWLVFEQSADESPAERPRWRLVRDRCYGKSRLLFYQFEKEGK